MSAAAAGGPAAPPPTPAPEQAGGSAHHAGGAATEFQHAMHGAMLAMDRAMVAAPMSGDADQDFLAMMIPHHEGAVEMARPVLIHGRDPLVRQLAEEIIAGQQAEIVSMRARLAVLQSGVDPAPFPSLSGTRGPAPSRR